MVSSQRSAVGNVRFMTIQRVYGGSSCIEQLFLQKSLKLKCNMRYFEVKEKQLRWTLMKWLMTIGSSQYVTVEPMWQYHVREWEPYSNSLVPYSKTLRICMIWQQNPAYFSPLGWIFKVVDVAAILVPVVQYGLRNFIFFISRFSEQRFWSRWVWLTAQLR